MLESFISLMMANRKVFVLHERNQAAFENLHRQQHDDEHTDMAARFRAVLSDSSVAIDQRVRMACALGAVMGGLVLAGDAFAQVPSEDLGAMLRGAIGDVLGSPSEKPTRRAAKRAPRPTALIRSKGPARPKGRARPNGSA